MVAAIHARAWVALAVSLFEILGSMLLFYFIWQFVAGYTPEPIDWLIFIGVLLLVDLRLWHNFAPAE